MDVDINMTYVFILIALGVVAFLFHNGVIFKTFSKHDNSIIDKFLSKYPNVAPEFMKQGLREQNIENNQEIHANNIKQRELEYRIEHLEYYVKEMNENIQEQLKSIVEALDKNK